MALTRPHTSSVRAEFNHIGARPEPNTSAWLCSRLSPGVPRLLERRERRGIRHDVALGLVAGRAGHDDVACVRGAQDHLGADIDSGRQHRAVHRLAFVPKWVAFVHRDYTRRVSACATDSESERASSECDHRQPTPRTKYGPATLTMPKHEVGLLQKDNLAQEEPAKENLRAGAPTL